jgi:2-oxoglutarate ferredoxin oxidoreductase subunit gamma
MTDDRYEIRLSGSGGQGVILAGIILAEAAAIFDDQNAVQTQSYGPESRGGASRAEVIISSEEIDYPKVTAPDLLLTLTQEAYDKYARDLKPGGIVIYDDSSVEIHADERHKSYGVPVSRIARDVLEKPIAANIVALGALVAIGKVVSRSAIEQAVMRRVPKGTEELNLKALKEGFHAGEEALAGR